MCRAGLQGLIGRRKWNQTRSRATSPGPIRTSSGVTDITEHPTKEERFCWLITNERVEVVGGSVPGEGVEVF